MSRPTRGAWIEITRSRKASKMSGSRPTRGAWIEIVSLRDRTDTQLSRPTRGAWIEISVIVELVMSWFGRAPHGARGLKYRFVRPCT